MPKKFKNVESSLCFWRTFPNLFLIQSEWLRLNLISIPLETFRKAFSDDFKGDRNQLIHLNSLLLEVKFGEDPLVFVNM